ncbi:MAG: FtsX-like permease family protein [Sphaerochaetaceae bacterium]|jgi:putative ABC transport system permease protein|nr:ABC transporter permease [Sphaerochaeta sp.]MDD4218809.1 ABC transporter permease [Sphaerochaetaceae bacterium]MDY0371247.1 ABC transporter permease [Sphaerochaetaceae bacterium]
MMTKLPKIAFRNIFRNLRRSILSAVAIAVSAMSIVMLFGLLAGMEADMANNLQSYYTGEVRIQHAEFEKYKRYNPLHLGVDWKSIEPILADNHQVRAATARINFPANMYLGEKQHGVMGVGADFSSEEAFIDFPSILQEGRLPQEGKNEILMGFALARDMQLGLGDKVTLLSTTATRGSNAFTFEIVGIAGFPVAGLNANSIWAPIDRVQKFLGMDGQTQEILLLLEDGADEKQTAIQIANEIESKLGTATDTRSWTELNMFYGMLRIAKIAYYFIAMFFFVLGSTVIINTTMMVIFERMREIGMLSALGMHGSELTKLFLLEGFFISMIGSAVGVIIGYVGTYYMGKVGLNFTEAFSGMDIEISSILYPQTSILTALVVWAYAVVISTLSTFIPSRHASKIQPVEALRYV